MSASPAASRTIVVGLVQDRQGRVLLCKMPPNRGYSPEFSQFSWVEPADLERFDLNLATRQTLRQAGLL